MSRRVTTEEFVRRAKLIHGDKYDYSDTTYVNTKTKVTILCSIHGVFEMLPGNHTHKTRPQNCGKCSGQGLDSGDWIERFRNKFGNNFDYSRFEYTGYYKEIVIICPIHGEIITTPRGHLGSPTGCERCSSEKTGKEQRTSTDLWLRRFRDKHGDRFDYSLFSPTNQYQKCTIICREHGPFEQTPKMHWNSEHGCPKCAIIGSGLNRRITPEEFISRSSSIHEGKYDYSNSDYTTGREKVSILCPIHGEFLQSPRNHLQGQGCWDCGQLQSALNQRTTDEEWILQFFEAHGDTYDYSKFASSGAEELATIICPEHGEFEQSPIVHSKGHGCWGCGQLQSSLNRRITTDEWINRFRKRHGDEYDYSLFVATTKDAKSTVICSKHGEFQQSPNAHWRGQGCPKCLKKNQTKLFNILVEIFPDLEIIYDFKHPNMRFAESNRKMELDIWIPEISLAIEYQGEQHFEEFWQGYIELKEHQQLDAGILRDEEKRVACKKEGIMLIEIPYTWDSTEIYVRNKLRENGIKC